MEMQAQEKICKPQLSEIYLRDGNPNWAMMDEQIGDFNNYHVIFYPKQAFPTFPSEAGAAGR